MKKKKGDIKAEPRNFYAPGPKSGGYGTTNFTLSEHKGHKGVVGSTICCLPSCACVICCTLFLALHIFAHTPAFPASCACACAFNLHADVALQKHSNSMAQHIAWTCATKLCDCVILPSSKQHAQAPIRSKAGDVQAGEYEYMADPMKSPKSTKLNPAAKEAHGPPFKPPQLTSRAGVFEKLEVG